MILRKMRRPKEKRNPQGAYFRNQEYPGRNEHSPLQKCGDLAALPGTGSKPGPRSGASRKTSWSSPEDPALLFWGPCAGPPDTAVSGVYQGIEIFIPLKDILQFDGELKRLDKEIQKTRKDWQQTEKKLSNEDFLQKAPAEVIRKEKEKVQVLGKKDGKAGRARETPEGADDLTKNNNIFG